MTRKPKEHRSIKPPAMVWLWSARLLIAAAMAGSAYLAWAALAGDRLPGCGPRSGCDEVLGSRWAHWFGIPVSFAALLVYGALAAVTLTSSADSSISAQRRLRAISFFAALLTLGAALWFLGLQVFVLHAFCPYCLTVHGCGAAAALMILLRFPLTAPRNRVGQPADPRLVGRRPATCLVLGALLTIALLGLGQTLYQPPVILTRDLPIGSAPEVSAGTPSAASEGRTPDAAKPGPALLSSAVFASRMLRVHGGAFEFNLDEVPMAGSVDATGVIVNLFDYTCPHCRVLHGFMKDALRTFSNKLAVVSLAAPLDPGCNPLVTRNLPTHTNACAYARIGLAVWRADREQGQTFDDWMFSTPRPPDLGLAREHAMELVGTNAFDQASADPWIARELELNIRLFATNYHLSRISQLPQLIVGTNIVSGNFRRATDLYRVLSNHLGLVAQHPAAP